MADHPRSATASHPMQLWLRLLNCSISVRRKSSAPDMFLSFRVREPLDIGLSPRYAGMTVVLVDCDAYITVSFSVTAVLFHRWTIVRGLELGLTNTNRASRQDSHQHVGRHQLPRLPQHILAGKLGHRRVILRASIWTHHPPAADHGRQRRSSRLRLPQIQHT